MATSAPASIADYQAILDAAYRNLGQATANIDKQEEAAKQAYAMQLAASNTNRSKSSKQTNENDSARGFLHSGINLQDQSDVNQAYDQQNQGYLMTQNAQMAELARQRLAAQNSYDDANVQFQNYRTAALNPLSPGVMAPGGTATDPWNWLGYAAAHPVAAPKPPAPVKSNIRTPTIPAVKTPISKPKPVRVI